jgi:arylsulfatase A-like enzyme
MYHRFEHRLTSDNRANYLDNLELADETLGLLRRAMEAAGIWNDSILLVTGDHGFRPFVWSSKPSWDTEEARAGALVSKNRVPFLVKMLHQKAGVVHGGHFNTILTRDLFIAMLTGELQDARQIGQWIRAWASLHAASNKDAT